MQNDLREGDLHAVIVEEQFDVSGQHTLRRKDVRFRRTDRELEIHAAVSQRVHAEIPRRGKIQIRMLRKKIRKLFRKERLQFPQVGAVTTRFSAAFSSLTA